MPSQRSNISTHSSTAVVGLRQEDVRNLYWLWPLMACITGWWLIAKRFDYPAPFDAEHVYLPAAMAFLEQGWAYWLTPDSYRVVPLAYLWPALWQGEPFFIRIANGGLWAGCVCFLWHTGCMLGGYRTGAIAVVLLAAHPELPRYFPTELTEPIFLFGIFGWIYAVARILIKGQSTWGTSLFGAAMLSMTLLSRPVLQLLAPACLALSLVCLAYSKINKQKVDPKWQRSLACLSWSLTLGLILPLALLIKNGVVFGLWGLGTGSGAGLYLGTNPLSQGSEPPFLGLDYDVNGLATLNTGNGDHLSSGGDKALRMAALWQIHSMSTMEGSAFFGRKLWWWLAHHPSQIDAFGGALRKLRFFELLAVAASIACLVKDRLRHVKQSVPQNIVFAGFLLVMFLTMLAQLLPVLYNSRYSSALLDPWLILLAAWALARLTAPIQLQGAFDSHRWSIGMVTPQGTSLWPTITVLAIILAVTFAGYNLTRQHETIAIDPMHMGQTRAHLEISASSRTNTHGMEPRGDHTWVIAESPAILQVRLDQDDIDRIRAAGIFNALWKTEIAAHSSKHCRKTDISYQTWDNRILQPTNKRSLLLPLQTDGVFHTLVTHANAELRPREPGSLRIVLHCPVGTEIRWRSTQLLESRHIWNATAHIKPQFIKQ